MRVPTRSRRKAYRNGGMGRVGEGAWGCMGEEPEPAETGYGSSGAAAPDGLPARGLGEALVGYGGGLAVAHGNPVACAKEVPKRYGDGGGGLEVEQSRRGGHLVSYCQDRRDRGL